MSVKTCTRCGEEKPLDAFAVVVDKRRSSVTRRGRCRPCQRLDSREKYAQYKADPERWREIWGPEAQRRREYGLSREQYDALVLASEGRCAICNRPTPDLVIDHDHATGDVRGLLCGGCNTAIGMLGETPEGVTRALAYLLSASDGTYALPAP